ncbi:MAG: helix-turn-helix domain-containing protein [Gemmatimonadota bacterium]|nr:helix-turn-helix domain-containing protein [Gemmatimonadota bacterium]
MSVILTLISHPGRLARLRAATRDSHTVVACDDWEQVFSACDGRLIHAAVLDLEAAVSPTFDAIRRFKRINAAVALIAYTTYSPEKAHHIFDAGRYGFEALVMADMDDGPSAFARAIEKASARGVAAMVRSGLAPAADPLATDALLAAISRAHERLTPARLAHELAVGPRRLARALSLSGYPSTHKLIMWARLLVAASMMDGTRHSTDRIALNLSFPSGSAFRNNCRRYLGAKPSEIRAMGGATMVFGLLRDSMGERPRPS